jgi:hypothetical protein
LKERNFHKHLFRCKRQNKWNNLIAPVERSNDTGLIWEFNHSKPTSNTQHASLKKKRKREYGRTINGAFECTGSTWAGLKTLQKYALSVATHRAQVIEEHAARQESTTERFGTSTTRCGCVIVVLRCPIHMCG